MALAALESCFRAVPPDAVAAVVDCVLASSSTSPSQLFHSLLDSFPAASSALHPAHAHGHGHAASLSHAAALCHLLPHLSSSSSSSSSSSCSKDNALRALLRRVFLPLLRGQLQQQAVALMCDAVSAAHSSWDLLGATILPFCVRSCAAAMAMPAVGGHEYSDDASMYRYYRWDDAAAEDGHSSSDAGLPLPEAAALLAALLGDALERRRTALPGENASLDALVRSLTWDLSRLVLEMFGHGQECRSCATAVLLRPRWQRIPVSPSSSARSSASCRGQASWSPSGTAASLCFLWAAPSGSTRTIYSLSTSRR